MDVKSIVKEKGFTIEQVAKEMGITRFTFTQNLNRNPTMRTLQRIADVLGCKVGDFFKDEIEPSEFVALVKCNGNTYSVSSIPEARMLLDKLDEKK
jgi:transcriptional regulator with XRE-family HTH domain